MTNRTLTTAVLCVVALALRSAAFAQTPPEKKSPADPTAQVVKSVVGPWIEKYQPPGTIVVVHREGTTEFFPFGEAHPRRRVPVTPDSIFELASITKVF